MKYALGMAFALSCTFLAQAADTPVSLFNGKDLTGWKVAFNEKDKATDPTKVFLVKDGVMIVTGKPTCYIYTEKSFSNYVLSFDWRYPADSKPDSNSGSLVHIQLPHKVMPKSIEPQGRYKDHGKLFYLGGLKGEAKFYEEAHKKVLKPMGEWSTTEVTCEADGKISVKLNGTLVADGKTELTSGMIGFQCEGWEIHFRNIKLVQK